LPRPAALRVPVGVQDDDLLRHVPAPNGIGHRTIAEELPHDLFTLSAGGPWAPDLLNPAGRDLIAACPVCSYAGITVHVRTVWRKPSRRGKLWNTASLSWMISCGRDPKPPMSQSRTLRVHSGIFRCGRHGAEQLRRLRDLAYQLRTLTPGVPCHLPLLPPR